MGRRTLQWVGHVARMDKSRLPRRLLTAWVREPRPEFGQKMNYGRSLERWLKLFGLPLRYTEWAPQRCSDSGGNPPRKTQLNKPNETKEEKEKSKKMRAAKTDKFGFYRNPSFSEIGVSDLTP